MKKILIGLVMFGLLFSFSPVVHAVDMPSVGQMTQSEKDVWIKLITQMIAILQKQLEVIIAQETSLNQISQNNVSVDTSTTTSTPVATPISLPTTPTITPTTTPTVTTNVCKDDAIKISIIDSPETFNRNGGTIEVLKFTDITDNLDSNGVIIRSLRVFGQTTYYTKYGEFFSNVSLSDENGNSLASGTFDRDGYVTFYNIHVDANSQKNIHVNIKFSDKAISGTRFGVGVIPENIIIPSICDSSKNIEIEGWHLNETGSHYLSH